MRLNLISSATYDFAIFIPHFDMMQTLDAGFLHFVRNRMAAIAREAIYAGAN
jgi:hypothetical protein